MSELMSKGLIPKAAHDAMIEELQGLFEGKTFSSKDGEKELTVFGQLYPIQTSNDNGRTNDLVKAARLAPSLLVAISGGEVKAYGKKQVVDFQIVACAYDGGVEREGFTDVYIMLQEIMHYFEQDPVFGSNFEVQYPITWGIQQETSAPYYYGAVSLPVAMPLAVVRTSRNKKLEDLI